MKFLGSALWGNFSRILWLLVETDFSELQFLFHWYRRFLLLFFLPIMWTDNDLSSDFFMITVTQVLALIKTYSSDTHLKSNRNDWTQSFLQFSQLAYSNSKEQDYCVIQLSSIFRNNFICSPDHHHLLLLLQTINFHPLQF